MKVFVAGATGVLGRRAVTALIDAGHEVTAVARSPEKADLVRELGAAPIGADLFDAEEVRGAVVGHDAVVNLATHIPPLRKIARSSAWVENDRIRTEASRNLAEAAVQAGAKVYVQESICFLTGDHGDEWLDEDVPLVPSPHTESLQAAESAAAAVTEAGGRGVVLRFGRFLADDSPQIAAVMSAASLGLFVEPGDDDAYLPTIQADDAALAVVAALDAPAGVYHVADEPLTRGEHRRALAAAVGRRRLLRPPRWAVRLLPRRMVQMQWSQRTTSERFRTASGWTPLHRDAGDSYRVIASTLGFHRGRLRPALALALWVLALAGISLGLQALTDPEGFYTDFPGGRGWVAADGPFNEHLIRDFAALNLAIGALALGAAVSRSRTLVRAAGAAWLLYSVPHLVYHVGHLDVYEGFDLWGNVVALSGLVVLALVALLAPIARPPATPRLLRTPPGAGAAPPGGNGGRSRRRSSPGRAASA